MTGQDLPVSFTPPGKGAGALMSLRVEAAALKKGPFQPLLSFGMVRHHLTQETPEQLAVVRMDQMTKLMGNHIIDAGLRRLYQVA